MNNESLFTVKESDGFYDFEAALTEMRRLCCQKILSMLTKDNPIDLTNINYQPSVNTYSGSAEVTKIFIAGVDNVIIIATDGDRDFIFNIEDLLMDDLISLYEFIYQYVIDSK